MIGSRTRRSNQYALIIAAVLSSLLVTPNSAIAATCAPTSITSGSQVRLTFTSTGTCQWTVPAGVQYMKFLIVGGGGGGGGGAYGGGGGGGAVITSTSIAVTAGTSMNIAVGAGGNGGTNSTGASNVNGQDTAGANGGDSSIGTYVAKGGGGGAGFFTGPFNDRAASTGKVGGNQGGGSQNSFRTNLFSGIATNQATASSLSANNKINVYGNHDGGGTLGASYIKAGAGGGGAESPGKSVLADARGGDGGSGASVTITGTTTFFGGGGGGGVTNYGSSYVAGAGGAGGGGAGGILGDGESGGANTGGGGGGAGYNGTPQFGGAGGSGIVVITYRSNVCVQDGACSVGDEGPAAGYIFYIDTATNTAYEATPKYWQTDCAAGGLCNLADIGFGGGAIISTAGGSYIEMSPDNLDFFGTYLLYDASSENTSFFATHNAVEGRWRNANISDYVKVSENLGVAGLFGSVASIISDDYWTLDRDSSQSNSPFLINPHSGQITTSNGGSQEEHRMRLFSSYTSRDSQEQFTDENNLGALATGISIGTGKSNTDLMTNSSLTGVAQIAANLVFNGKSDWYLPSLNEMKALASQASQLEGLGEGSSQYWTSSTLPTNRDAAAYYVNTLDSNGTYAAAKIEAKSLRPIRSFSIAGASAPSLSLAMNSGLRTATFRTSNTITATSTQSGKVTFFADGKRIAGCISLATSANAVSCTWKPSVRGTQRLTAVLKTVGGQYSTIQNFFITVVSRTNLR